MSMQTLIGGTAAMLLMISQCSTESTMTMIDSRN